MTQRPAAWQPVARSLQRRCACGGSAGDCSCDEERVLHRSASGPATALAPAGVDAVLAEPGQPLPDAVRGRMEASLRHDFSRVRVHDGPRASASARAVNAHAYTVGQDIVFAAGRYAPHSAGGSRLLAHELAHTAQQAAASGGGPLRVSQPGDAAERQADAAAEAVAQGGTTAVTPTPRGLAREVDEPHFAAACKAQTPAEDPCQPGRCTDEQARLAQGDLERGAAMARKAAAAIKARPRGTLATRALDWYFGATDDKTASTAATRFECIARALDGATFGCHPDSPGPAYSCVPDDASICGDHQTPICFSDLHFFASGPISRASDAIHEGGHLQGLSLSKDSDIYDLDPRMLDLSTSRALYTTETYSLFAFALETGNIPNQYHPVAELGGGAALSAGSATWYSKLYAGVELQRPKMTVWNPGLGIGAVLIGESSPGGGAERTSKTVFVDLVASLRRGSPRRPGSRSSRELTLSAGIGGAFDADAEVSLGAEVGVSMGFRWRVVGIKIGASYIYDGSRADAEVPHIFSVGLSLTGASKLF